MKRRAAISRGLSLLIDEDRVEAAEWRCHAATPSCETRSALFKRYRAFARKIAAEEWRRTSNLGLDLADMEQVASEALLHAIDRFDPARGAPFTAYARIRLRGAIRNAFPKATEATAYYSARKRMERERMRSLKNSALDKARDPLYLLRELTAQLALGFILEGTAEKELESVPSNDPSAYDALYWSQLILEVDSRIAALPEKERTVLDCHYRQQMQFQEIASLLGLSKGRISQLHTQALQRLRKHLSKHR